MTVGYFYCFFRCFWTQEPSLSITERYLTDEKDSIRREYAINYRIGFNAL